MNVQITIDGRLYRVTEIRTIGNNIPFATAEYYHPDRGWREVKNWGRLEQLARIVLSMKASETA